MKITRVEIHNYRGVEHQEFPVGAAGAIIKGRSKSGKTSVLDAIAAALAGQGAEPSSIRQGADRAEILVDMDHASVRRIIRRSGNNELKTDGLGLGKPQSRLDELFGNLLDPLALARAKPAARQKMVLEIMPAPVTAEDLQRWTGDPEWTPTPGKHGLEVIAEVRQHYYDLRRSQNAGAKEAEKVADEKRAAAEAAVSLAPKEALPVEEAEAAAEKAEKAMEGLEERRRQATEQEARAAGTREKIALLRGEAVGKIDVRPTPEEIDASDNEYNAAKETLESARLRMEDAKAASESIRKRLEAADRIDKERADRIRQAADLEASLASLTVAAPTPEEIAAAADAGCRAATALQDAQKLAAATRARAEFEAAEKAALEAKSTADHLDAIVERLTTDAPAELGARHQMIPGLTFVDGDIALDGKVFGLLSGTECIEVCTEVAKRANPKAKLIRVNGLEQIDDDTLVGFVKHATADGWQLLGTRVEKGELQIVALEPADEEAPAGEPAKVEKKEPRMTIVMPDGQG